MIPFIICGLCRKLATIALLLMPESESLTKFLLILNQLLPMKAHTVEKPTFFPEITKNLMFGKCEFCGK